MFTFIVRNYWVKFVWKFKVSAMLDIREIWRILETNGGRDKPIFKTFPLVKRQVKQKRNNASVKVLVGSSTPPWGNDKDFENPEIN